MILEWAERSWVELYARHEAKFLFEMLIGSTLGSMPPYGGFTPCVSFGVAPGWGQRSKGNIRDLARRDGNDRYGDGVAGSWHAHCGLGSGFCKRSRRRQLESLNCIRLAVSRRRLAHLLSSNLRCLFAPSHPCYSSDTLSQDCSSTIDGDFHDRLKQRPQNIFSKHD